ncbi:MAG: glyoxalase, partial [Paenibacillus sp.]|nr:glyoxalase [Paenibacillus sp.]
MGKELMCSMTNDWDGGNEMILHESIHHASLIVTDLERSKAFYEQILGLRELERPAF